MSATLVENGTVLNIHIPWKLRRRGGKKVIITPNGRTVDPSSGSAMPDDPLVRALAKARRWQMRLESGEVATIGELAAEEGVDRGFISRTLKLNDLAPVIVESILSGNYPDTINLETLRQPFPAEWDKQVDVFGLFRVS
jgi:hypothetical protein